MSNDLNILKARLVLVRAATTYGAFQRAKIYNETHKKGYESDKRKFRDWIFTELLETEISNFTSITSDTKFYTFLETTQNRINNSDFVYLFDNYRFRFGVTQKLVNLYWKMLWLIVPETPDPIHCPFDWIIIRKLRGVSDIKWTNFDSLGQYERLVVAAQKEASEKNQSTAEWELEAYLS